MMKYAEILTNEPALALAVRTGRWYVTSASVTSSTLDWTTILSGRDLGGNVLVDVSDTWTVSLNDIQQLSEILLHDISLNTKCL